MSRPPKHKLLLTRHALHSIQGIYDYSVERWGKRVAEKYLNELEAAIERI